MKRPLIDEYVEQVLRESNFNISESFLPHIKKALAGYAMCCLMDSAAAKEAEEVCAQLSGIKN